MGGFKHESIHYLNVCSVKVQDSLSGINGLFLFCRLTCFLNNKVDSNDIEKSYLLCEFLECFEKSAHSNSSYRCENCFSFSSHNKKKGKNMQKILSFGDKF